MTSGALRTLNQYPDDGGDDHHDRPDHDQMHRVVRAGPTPGPSDDLRRGRSVVRHAMRRRRIVSRRRDTVEELHRLRLRRHTLIMTGKPPSRRRPFGLRRAAKAGTNSDSHHSPARPEFVIANRQRCRPAVGGRQGGQRLVGSPGDRGSLSRETRKALRPTAEAHKWRLGGHWKQRVSSAAGVTMRYATTVAAGPGPSPRPRPGPATTTAADCRRSTATSWRSTVTSATNAEPPRARRESAHAEARSCTTSAPARRRIPPA